MSNRIVRTSQCTTLIHGCDHWYRSSTLHWYHVTNQSRTCIMVMTCQDPCHASIPRQSDVASLLSYLDTDQSLSMCEADHCQSSYPMLHPLSNPATLVVWMTTLHLRAYSLNLLLHQLLITLLLLGKHQQECRSHTNQARKPFQCYKYLCQQKYQQKAQLRCMSNGEPIS